MNEFSFTSFFGRFHPVLVHLPIGILLLAFLFELLSRTKRYSKLKPAVKPALFYGMLSAFVTVGSGYFLSQEGGYDEDLVDRHKWMAFITTGLSVLVYLFKLNLFSLDKADRKLAVLLMFFPMIILLVITGHHGGVITHGENFLFEQAPKKPSDPGSGKKISVAHIQEAKVYDDLVQPLLETKCYKCHSSKKQKGQLRLDAVENILKGGKNGKVIVPGKPLESEIFIRTSLSVEEKKHMPPRKETQLNASEIELIRWWIEQGASFEKKVVELSPNSELTSYFEMLATGQTHQSWLPEKEINPADAEMMKKLRSKGISAVPAGSQTNYLSVSFAGTKTVEQSDLETLISLAPQIIELNLAWTSITDNELKFISTLKELRRLHLEHTPITDAGLENIRSCNALTYLNIVGTRVSSRSMNLLSELKGLQEVYVFDTEIAKSPTGQFNPAIKIDTGGYTLPVLITDTLVFKRQ